MTLPFSFCIVHIYDKITSDFPLIQVRRKSAGAT
jgi:hypothetical protein